MGGPQSGLPSGGLAFQGLKLEGHPVKDVLHFEV